MTYLTEVIKKVGGPTLTTMKRYTLWIKPGSFYHLRIYQLKELKKCPHLVNLDPPKPNLEAPSMTSLRTHETTFEAARKNPQISPEAYQKAWDKYSDALKLHGCHMTAAAVRATPPPRGCPPQVVEMPCHLDLDQQVHNESHLPQRVPPTLRKKMILIRPSRWRFIPLNQREVPIAHGVTGWMMRRPKDSRAPGATSEDEVPLSMRAILILCLPSPSVMR